MEREEIDRLAKIIWEYMLMHQPLQKADAILALGSHDLRVAEYAAKLFLDGWASLLILSGGLGELTRDTFPKPEAEMFADIALQKGVPKDKILIENLSSNTGENILFTKKLLEGKGLNLKKFILVQKPYMERRAYATAKMVWGEKDFIAASPPIPFGTYSDGFRSKDEIINILVGDMQRIKLYPERGFQMSQDIPAAVWSAYELLVAAGFNRHLAK